jgi:hypothetical protein
VYGFYAGGNRTVEDVTLEGNIWVRAARWTTAGTDAFRGRPGGHGRVCRMASYDENGVDYGTIKYFIAAKK